MCATIDTQNGASGHKECHDVIPIAIVGLSCRLPGGARDPQSLWEILAQEHDLWQPIPRKGFNASALYHPDPGRSGAVS